DVRAITSNVKVLVLDPIESLLENSEHLLISPDGQLHLLPFEALQDELGGELLVENYQVSYLNSGRDLLRLDTIEPSNQPAVIVASPNYENAGLSDVNGRSGAPSGVQNLSRNFGDIQVGPLPGTTAEAEAIMRVLPNANLLTEELATENAVKRIQAPSILHIATHGFFLSDIISSTDQIASIAFTPPEALLNVQRLAENPCCALVWP
ncbi:MAG: CHAT domain-containing protein, partial [Leptolyngbya sp. RL_3_1]|nr:CHAT domain-containing protein [Leptolyngbya sp. RL_3_1]